VKGTPYRWRNTWRFLIQNWGEKCTFFIVLFQQYYRNMKLQYWQILLGAFAKFPRVAINFIRCPPVCSMMFHARALNG
jgi:hypothetical protein